MSTAISNTDVEYLMFVDSMGLPDDRLFTTDVDLWPIYLDSFASPKVRQHYNCHTCKNFIRRYGGLVTINDDGTTTSAVWNPESAPEEIRQAIQNMKDAVERSRVAGVFVSSLETLGTRDAGYHHHYYLKNPTVHNGRLFSDSTVMAQKREDYETLTSSLAGYSPKHLEAAQILASSNALYRSEKVLGHIDWLFSLKNAMKQNPSVARNLAWKAVASAPPGYCTPRSSVLGSLLEDLGNNLQVSVAAKRFADKMHPLRYRRPTAAPTDGAIDAAEKLVEKLGVARSLDRRYATIEDMQTVWAPVEGGIGDLSVFGHLKNAQADTSSVCKGNITWVKFAAEVLPKARGIDVYIPSGSSDYTIFATATHSDAPVIFQWDNPVSWYHWNGGCQPRQVGLNPGWAKCYAVCLHPHMWSCVAPSNFEKAMAFLISGAREVPHIGLSLFPEALKSEYHGIRKVIERHSKVTKLTDTGAAHVIGKGVGARVRVDIGVLVEYTIDRWE